MMIDPPEEQANQCAIVQQELVEAVNRLLAEGMDIRAVTAGIGASAAATINTLYGPAEVPNWFAKQAALAMGLGFGPKPKH